MGGGHDRRGEGRDERRQPQAEHDGAWQHVGGPRRTGTDPGQQDQPGAGEQRADDELGSRSDSLGQGARPGREHEHQHGDGEQRHARLQCRPARGDLELVGDEKERQPERAEQEHGHEVHDREGAVAE